MALSILDDLSVEPDNDQVMSVLNDGMESWSSLESWLRDTCGVDGWEWGHSGKKYGWALRGKKGKRTIVYMIPQQGSFLVGLVLGDRAMEAVRRVSLSSDTLDVILSAKKYGEGTGFRLPVATVSDLDDIKTLVEVKIAH